MKISELKLIVDAFKDSIMHFTNLLMSKYQLDDNPIHHVGKTVPRSGELAWNGISVKYRYHGAGCSVEFGGLKLEYDILPNDKTIKISSWKFRQFLISYLKIGDEEISDAEVNLLLQDLEKCGLAKKISWSVGQFEIE